MTYPVVGLVDSGVAGDPRARCIMATRFRLDSAGDVIRMPVEDDPFGHGTAVAAVIAGHAPTARLANAQVFHGRGVASAAAVAEAIDWLVAAGVRLINLSLGLREDRTLLRSACRRACDGGAILLAASPARGAAVYPAAYPGVIRVTGDARCGADEISVLDTAQGDFGACVHSAQSGRPLAGASAAVAHVTGLVAVQLGREPEMDAEQARCRLREMATYSGPERRAAVPEQVAVRPSRCGAGA